MASIRQTGARPTGLDFSFGMLQVAQRVLPDAPLVQADLEAPLPFYPGLFDAVLCALIGEHLQALGVVLREFRRALRPGGRLIFYVYHPDMVDARKEANFAQGNAEYRLGAIRRTVDDYPTGG